MALVSPTRIANLALSLVHTKGIESLEDDVTTEAIVAGLWYDQARRETLAAFNWNFARVRLTLATHAEDPPEFEWSFRYQHPSDCVFARYLENPAGVDEDAVPFSIEQAAGSQSIVTDLDDAVLVYTRDEESTSLFTPHFVSTHAARLSYYMAGTLSGKKDLQADLLKLYNGWLAVAASIDASQGVERKPREADWIRAR